MGKAIVIRLNGLNKARKKTIFHNYVFLRNVSLKQHPVQTCRPARLRIGGHEYTAKRNTKSICKKKLIDKR